MTATRWLDRRQPPMPAPLRIAVVAALERSGGAAGGEDPAGPDDLPHRLASAGLDTLARVARAAPERSTATELLAADALLTYACEAAAEVGPHALDRLLGELGWSRFAHLLEPAGP